MRDADARDDLPPGRRRWLRVLAILVVVVLVLAAAAGYVVESGLGPIPVRPSPAEASPPGGASRSATPSASSARSPDWLAGVLAANDVRPDTGRADWAAGSVAFDPTELASHWAADQVVGRDGSTGSWRSTG